MRPVLSMPGSAYHRVAKYVADCLKIVPQCKINASSKEICDKIKTVILEEDEEVVSYDVVSLYTNVPVMEAIEVCTGFLYNLPADQRPDIDRDTFVILAKIASCNVIMSTHDGYYYQKDGLAMGSPPAPHLANGWLSQYDDTIRDGSKIYFRYMDDIIKEEKSHLCNEKLENYNKLHSKLNFTIDRENNSQLPVLDMKVLHDHETGKLSSTWYSKPTDTGLIMNFHALAPKRYKRSVVSGFVHRIYRACSSWSLFHESLEKAKRILEKNQYSPAFYDPIINKTIEKLVCPPEPVPTAESEEQHPPSKSEKFKLSIQYRGKCTEDFARALHKLQAPCMVVMTLRKLKTVLPSIKPPVDKMLRSGVVYHLRCPRCSACYVGSTNRHLQTRVKEHHQKPGPMKIHLAQCKTSIPEENIDVLQQTNKGENFLLTLEALHQRESRPALNTKEEWKSRELTIKL